MRTSLGRNLDQGPRRFAWILCSVAALSAAGCALTLKSEPIAPRYFSPDRAGDTARSSTKLAGVPPELRLGRINGASHLDERLIFRDSDYELGYYDERRWTEEPAEYLRRRLARVLFEERGLRHVLGGFAPTLEVELTSFEEIRSPKRIARVQVAVRLQDARIVRWEETMTVEQPITSNDKVDLADAMVAALGVALSTTVDKIADHVVSDLTAPPPPAPTPPPATSARRP
jgi:cholesterol transport system auxiliary component